MSKIYFRNTEETSDEAVTDQHPLPVLDMNVSDRRYKNVATQATFIVSNEPCRLYAIVCNTPVASGVITVYDGTTTADPTIATITLPGTLLQNGPLYAEYNLNTLGGLMFVTSGSNTNWTVIWGPAPGDRPKE